MSLSRFPEIRAEHWPDRVKLDFPRRRIGNVRWLGLVPMLVSVGFVVIPLNFIWPVLKQFSRDTHQWFSVLLLLFPLVFVLAASVPFRFGLFILCGRSRLVATRDHIKAIELAPFVRRTRKIRVADIERLEWVEPGESQQSDVPQYFRRLGALSAKTKQGASKLLLLGYPGEWMEEVGKELSEFLRFASAGVALERVEPLRSESEPVDKLPDLEKQPANSKVKLTRAGSALNVQVPPLGLASRSGGMIWFAFFWLLMVGILTFFFIRPTHFAFFGPLLFLSIFWVIGFAILYFGLRMALRRAEIKADTSELIVTYSEILKTKTFVWAKADLTNIKAGASGMKINDKPVLELQVFAKTGKKGLLAGRDESELQWLATELRHTLGLSPESEATSRGALETEPS